MSVADEDVFHRRVRWAKRITDQRSGEIRPSSDSFRDSTDPPSPMSGLLRSVVLATGRSIDSLVPGDGGDALVEFDVRDLLSHGFEVVVSPEEDEPAHAHVVGGKEALDPPAPGRPGALDVNTADDTRVTTAFAASITAWRTLSFHSCCLPDLARGRWMAPLIQAMSPASECMMTTSNHYRRWFDSTSSCTAATRSASQKRFAAASCAQS